MFRDMEAIKLGMSDDFNVFWDIQNSPNGHVGLIGSSGGGKSVMAQYIMLEIIKQGGTVLVIDKHGTLTDDQIFGQFVDVFNIYRNDVYAYADGIPCKFFDPIIYDDGTTEHIEDTVGAIADTLARALNLSVNQKTILRMAVQNVIQQDTYKEWGFKAIEKALLELGTRKATELTERLHYLFVHNPFVHGDGLLETGKINIVHLSRLDLTSQDIMSELLMAYIWRLGNADVFKKENFFLFVDECQNYESSSRNPLALMISEGRRMGINLILATQMVLQGTTNSVQQRISQCGLMLYFRPASNRISLTANMINPNDKDRYTGILADLQVGEFIATGNLKLENRQISYPLRVNAFMGQAYKPESTVEVRKTVNGVQYTCRE